jgi:uncharacterized membrane protein HdeD (DUF308 family)
MEEPVRIIDPPRSDGIMLVPTVPRPRAAHTGWTVFAGTMMVIVGLWNIVFGFFEILNDYYFTGDTVAAGSHSLWGWLYIGVGVVTLLIAGLVLAHNPTGVVLAVLLVGFNALTHAFGFGSEPWWSIVALVLDGLVLFALLNYGIRLQENRRRATIT